MTDSLTPPPNPAEPGNTPEPEAATTTPPELVLAMDVPVAEPAPLVVMPPPPANATAPAATDESFRLPLQLINALLAKIGATPLHSLADLLPVVRILSLAVVAGIALKLTSATIGAIDELPLVGGLLELVGLVSLLNFLARNAFKQQKRAELLARIQKLKTDLLG